MNINDLTPTQISAITAASAVECIRQGDSIDRVGFLLRGYQHALENMSTRPSAGSALLVAGLVEPDNRGVYRTTPVTFQSGGGSADPSAIPSAVGRLFSLLDTDTDAREFVRHYLRIHPLADGNGRTSFVLYNWIKGTLLNPEPLPDFDW